MLLNLGCRLQGKAFAETGHFMRSMEAVAVAASQQEPVLLVGETGTGKTTLVQHLAEQVSAFLHSWTCHASFQHKTGQ